MDGDRNEMLKRRAYAIWEKEGRPDGRHEEHWRQAHEEMHGLEDVPAHAHETLPHVAPAGGKDRDR